MKFKINRDHFSNGLAQVINVVGNKVTMPILSNVLIEAGKDHITLTTTNLDLGIRAKIKAEVSEPGSITLGVKRLKTIVDNLPDINVSFDCGSNHVVKLSSGGSTYRITGMGNEEFPPLSEYNDDKSLSFEQDELATMLESVRYAQSSDETRYILNGTFFSIEDSKLSLVATDGRRLSIIAKEINGSKENTGHFILPAKTVDEILRMQGKGSKIKISFSDRRVAFQIATDKDNAGLMDSIYLYSKVVEGAYPNYNQVIPKETHHRIKLERELFLGCIRRASLVCSDKSMSVKLQISSNNLVISAQSPDLGEAHEEMAIAYSGPNIQVAFNPNFMMDPLKALKKDEVFFELKDEVSPGVIKTADNFTCVIMPVRLV